MSVKSTVSGLYGRIPIDLKEEEMKRYEEENLSEFYGGRTCNNKIFCLIKINEKKTRQLNICSLTIPKHNTNGETL